MGTILVVNAGSSSVKFQVFTLERSDELVRKIKGQMDGIGTRPRLRASGQDASSTVDREYDKNAVPSVP
ncbi:MAG: acetate kinase, partial [Xanthobacteraceae bacterium]